jgi:hypothetical protein
VHYPADTVTNIFSHDPITGILGQLLNCGSDVTDVIPGDRLSDTGPHTFFGYIEKVLRFGRYLANSESRRIIPHPATDDGPGVNRDNIPF